MAAWTAAEILTLKRLAALRRSRAEMARQLGRSARSVHYKLLHLRLTRRQRPWTRKELDQLRAWYSTVPLPEIARRLGRSCKAVASQAHYARLNEPARYNWQSVLARELVLDLLGKGLSPPQIAERVERSPAQVYAYLREAVDAGVVVRTPAKSHGFITRYTYRLNRS